MLMKPLMEKAVSLCYKANATGLVDGERRPILGYSRGIHEFFIYATDHCLLTR